MSKKKTNSRSSKGSGYAEDYISSQAYFLRIVLFAVLLFAIAGGTFLGIRHFFYSSKLFEIKEICVNVKSEHSFDENLNKLNEFYLGRNIFTVDLKQIQVITKEDFPQFKEIEIRRNFPNMLEFDIVPREPVAVIDSVGGVVVDSEGIVLAVGESTEGIVMIKGINFFLKMPEKGDRIKNGALNRALLLIRGLSKKGDVDTKNIDFINVHDRNNIQLSISGVVVKIGRDNFVRKIDSLKEILNDPELNIKDLKYIDLRFEDAVLSFR